MYFAHCSCPAVYCITIWQTTSAVRNWFRCRRAYDAMFQAGWFVESMWSQTLVIHMIRTQKLPFIQSRASAPLTLLTCTGIAVLTIIPFTAFGRMLGFVALPMSYFAYLISCILLYMALATSLKKAYVRHYSELLWKEDVKNELDEYLDEFLWNDYPVWTWYRFLGSNGDCSGHCCPDECGVLENKAEEKMRKYSCWHIEVSMCQQFCCFTKKIFQLFP